MPEVINIYAVTESEEDESDDDQKSHLQSHSQQKIDAAEVCFEFSFLIV
jgi:hypothetical protein